MFIKLLTIRLKGLSINFSKNILYRRAKILTDIRAFFACKEVLEIETPLLGEAPVTDAFLQALSLRDQGKTFYLQTSPEYAMKRLLCLGIGSIYQLCKAFRAEEKGILHQTEFTMLEWYRIGFTHHDLMAEMDEFLQAVILAPPAKKLSYQAVFEHYIHINPHNITVNELQEQLIKKNIIAKLNKSNKLDTDTDNYLNLLFSVIIEPALKNDYFNQPVFIYDYPVSQCALAKINHNKAERFEVYLNGIELANGYHELQDPLEYQERAEKDLKKRQLLNIPLVPVDNNLLQALEKQGLPKCSGVALGVDRLVMLALNQSCIASVIALAES